MKKEKLLKALKHISDTYLNNKDYISAGQINRAIDIVEDFDGEIPEENKEEINYLKENYFGRPKKEIEKLFSGNNSDYFDRSKQGFPSEDVLKKQIDDHILLGGDKPIWFAENKITHNWIKKTFNPSEIEITKDWQDTLIPNEAMFFISREECLDWINKNELRLMYEPTDHLFSLSD